VLLLRSCPQPPSLPARILLLQALMLLLLGGR
jgi:hypothetical protein